MTTNPDRLYVCGYKQGGVQRWHAEENAEAYDGVDVDAEPVAYVPAVIVDALRDYSDEITVRICQMAEDLGLKSEPLEVSPDAAEVLSAIHDVLSERAALRAEVEALRGRVEKLRTGVEDALSVYELTANGVAQAVIGDVQNALDADAAAAAKGVG